ncbi:hypothetical protein [Paenibacillus amylolyticus]|uniref:hypothetical protein n=1 Tax=Paenibacillus amylolyticus TaxID=1451 RepID=UPI0039B099AC
MNQLNKRADHGLFPDLHNMPVEYCEMATPSAISMDKAVRSGMRIAVPAMSPFYLFPFGVTRHITILI